MKWSPLPLIPVAWGELFDKITILEIKQRRLSRPEQRDNAARELEALRSVAGNLDRFPAGLAPLVADLGEINEELWQIEEGKRQCEKSSSLDALSRGSGRGVYQLNDSRARLKREINLLLGSTLREEKSYWHRE